MASRSLGGVSITDMSRIPASPICRVRGMGVAERVRQSTVVRRCLSFSLAATPKRCSSSTTTRPRSLKTTSLESSRWVPTRMSILPAARPARVALISLALRKRETMSTVTGKGAKRFLKRLPVLEGEDGRGGQDRDLLAVEHRPHGAPHRDLGLAVAHVAADEPVHGRVAGHVRGHLRDGRGLVLRLFVLEGLLELALPGALAGEGVAGARLALGVELQELRGHVAHGLLDPLLDLLPVAAAQAVEGGAGALGARVLLHPVEGVDRHLELVPALVDEDHELAARGRRGRGSRGPRSGRCRGPGG